MTAIADQSVTGPILSYMCTTPPVRDPVTELLHALAKARGCASPDEIAEFLGALPRIDNPLLEMRDFNKAIDRIAAAIGRGENITIFGDYDCDGVTSCAQWINLLRAANHSAFRVYIPDRFIEDYGLTPAAVERCVELQSPKLIIAVDCGSTAIEALTCLRNKGIDVIVIDHHQVHHDGEHPSYAHLNPKGDPGLSVSRHLQDAANMSAAGLVFFVCDALAAHTKISWDREANLLLAGLGTLVDVMPLVGTNRALVKHSLALANSPVLDRVPGIKALLIANGWGRQRITEYTYGFVIGPCINATGRLAHAKTSLNLVCSRGQKATQYALELVQSNKDRKAIQETIVEEAIVQARQILAAAPETKVLVLYSKDWHTGIVGIVAGKVREQTGVPAIALARLENGFWKGSGRSVKTLDIGSFVKRAVDAGVLTSGGGHTVACGVKLTDSQISPFVRWVREESSKLTSDLRPTIEIVGDADWLTTDQWVEFFNRAAPFGNGNLRPSLEVLRPYLKWGPQPAERRDGTVWALKAGFQTPTHRQIDATWTDLEQARCYFAPDQAIKLVAEFERTEKNDRQFDNWRVVHAEFIE